jgi:hypothetical protein
MNELRRRRLVFHGLRKSAVVFLLEAGCSDAETVSITGQSRDMVEHYAKQVNQRRLAAAAILKWEAADAARTGNDPAGVFVQSASEFVQRGQENKNDSLISLVGAGRFELPTPSPPGSRYCDNSLFWREKCFARNAEIARSFPEFAKHHVLRRVAPSRLRSHTAAWKA